MKDHFIAKSLLALIVLIALAGPLHGQSFEIIPRSSELFTLTPSAPSAARPLLIDASPRVHVIVTARATDLDVALVSPGGTRYRFGTAATNFETVINPGTRVAGANYHGVLLNPTPGTWQLEVSAPALTSNLEVLVRTIFNNRVGVVLAGGSDSPVGVATALTVAAFDNNSQITNLQIVGRAYRPDGTSTSVVFHDNGAFPDAAANDGLYSAAVTSAIEGEHQVAVSVGGIASTGAFLRTAATTFRAVRRTALLDGTFTDNGFDTNGDGRFDGIYVAPRMNVSEAGTYTVTVRLRSSANREIQRGTTVNAGAGILAPQVRFATEDVVEALAANGPYSVAGVDVQRQFNATDFFVVDRRIDLGSTKPYTLAQFRSDRLRIVSGSATGIDTNGNGRFDLFRIDLRFETEVSGFFRYSGSLFDRNGAPLGLANGSRSLAVGTHTLSLTFNGRTIGENGVDGPYHLAFLIFGAGQSLVAPNAFSATGFRASQFEGFTADTTPPSLSVSVTPTELWPVNHEMIEITPTINVSDDIDPSPVVGLVSITSNEGDDVHGDGHTSNDIQIDNGRIFLRAERSGLGEGRIYTLTWSARDAAGNTSTATATVTVPHDKKK